MVVWYNMNHMVPYNTAALDFGRRQFFGRTKLATSTIKHMTSPNRPTVHGRLDALTTRLSLLTVSSALQSYVILLLRCLT